MEHGAGIENSKNIQEPQNYDNNHDRIQDRFDRSGHRYVTINQPEQNTHHDERHYDLN
jgi:hypothetical protein